MYPGYSESPIPALPPLPEQPNQSPFRELEYPQPSDDTGMTDPDVIPSAPVTQTPVVNAVNPVNDSIQAGLPDDESDSTTEQTKTCSFRLPLSVVQSMTHSVMRQKAVNPDYTFHRYGIDVLSNHEQYRQAAADRDRHKALYQNSLKKLSEYAELLTAEKVNAEELEGQLQDARDFALRNMATPQPVPQPQPVPPVPIDPPAVSPAEQDQYIRLKAEIRALIEENETYRQTLNSYQPFLNNIGPVLEGVYDEASRSSSWTPHYFRQIFERGIKPFLPAQQA